MMVTEVTVYRCDCGNKYAIREAAEACCVCPDCGGKNDHGSRCRCEKCRRIFWAKRDAEQLEAATDVSAEYTGPVFVGHDFFFGGVEDAIDQYFDLEPEDRPAFAHCAIARPFQIDLDDMLDVFEERHSDCCVDEFDYSRIGYDELKAAVEKYNEANAGDVLYDVDGTKKVRIPYETEGGA